MTAVGEPIPCWCATSPGLEEDAAFLDAVRAIHEGIQQELFADDPLVNGRLGVHLRAFRRLEGWRVLLVLTPWMLSRILVPQRDPGIPVPPAWQVGARTHTPYQVLGPQVTLEILGQAQQAHLNYHPRLGHYLLQPIALNMQSYDSPEAVFEAWNQVIRTRDESMERHRKDCPWQKEVSRREWFARMRGVA